MKRVFILSPANANGERARMLLNERAPFELAVRFRREGATVAEVFAFVSGLYFRGKATYVAAFADPPRGAAPSLTITPDRGLLPNGSIITPDDFRAMAAVPISLEEPRYLQPLQRDLAALAARVPKSCAVILLGSVATPKYVSPLLDAFGSRLLFPSDFAGRGDMSRGALMLRAARAGVELPYEAVPPPARKGSRTRETT